MALQGLLPGNSMILGCVVLLTSAVVLVLRRLVFHPLSKIPGPKLAALTWWYEIYYDVIQPGQYVFRIQELHKQYGPVVRVTPDEIHVNDLQYLDYIYAGPTQVRDKPLNGNVEIADSLAGTVDTQLHNRRRRAMVSFFSKPAIDELEPVIRAKIQKLNEAIDRHAANGTVVNLADLFYGLAWDVVFEYCFGFEAKLIDNESACARVRNNIRVLLQGGNAPRHFPWLQLLGKLPLIGKNFIPAGVFEMQHINEVVGKNITTVLDDKDNKQRSTNRSIFYDIRDDPGLPPTEKSHYRLMKEGSFLVLAGTESVAATMKITTFHILNNPTILEKVRKELDDLPNTLSLSQIERLPYLTACIQEGNRLSFGITVRNARTAPTPLGFGDHILPPGYRVSTTSLAVSGNSDYYPDPFAFKPERWLGAQAAISKKYEMAFGRGARRCIGMNLAYAELYLVLATLLRGFNFTLFGTDVTDVQFLHDYQVAHPKLDSKGVRATVKRRFRLW